MIYVITTLHLICCLVLILVVLLQTGKRADLAGAFGGGGSQTAFGTRGAATLLTKLTTGFAVMFMFTSIGLSIVGTQSDGETGSVLEDIPAPAADEVPVGDTAPVELPPLPAETDGSAEPTEGATE
jgi:preprotein translocase subunit SecG